MRRFTKKLQEKTKGSYKILGKRDRNELMEYIEKKGYRIIALKPSGCYLKKNESGLDHDIKIKLTENDALKLFKQLKPNTFSRKALPTEKVENKDEGFKCK